MLSSFRPSSCPFSVSTMEHSSSTAPRVTAAQNFLRYQRAARVTSKWMWRHYLRSPGFEAEGFAYAIDKANRFFHKRSRKTHYLPRRHLDTPQREAPTSRESAARPRQLPPLLTSPSALQTLHLGLCLRLHGPRRTPRVNARITDASTTAGGSMHDLLEIVPKKLLL
jgi:hypothetical protein